MDIVAPLAQAYAEKYTSPEASLLRDISFLTSQHPQANMLSGHVQGKFLEMISCLLQPRRILEIGTFMGYSAICLAKGLAPDGQLHTIELQDDAILQASANFKKAKALDQIILHTGNALQVIPSLDETWDLVFIDADKGGYIDYYDLVLPRLKQGGLIIADNVLFHGEVLEENITGKSARAIQAFNERVQRDDSVEKVMLTVRDGLLLIRKK